jgi:O-antigen/teichoic acid export membrane protein
MAWPAEATVERGSPASLIARGRPSMWRRTRHDVALLGAGSVVVVVAQLAFRGLLIGLLDPADYGRLALVLSIYNTAWIVGASGLPNAVARHISAIAPAADAAIVRSAVRAGVWPTAIAATAVGVLAAALLGSPLAFVFATIGLSSLVYSLLAMGILRGRGRTLSAASIMPIGGVAEVALLSAVLLVGLSVTALSAFAVFCAGNVVALLAGVAQAVRSAPRRHHASDPVVAPSSRQLLGFSIWLGLAAIGVAALPLAVRLAAAFDSYRIVALVDVALVLFTVPQRIGSVIVAAVVPHATRELHRGERSATVSAREHTILIGVFAALAAVVAFTPCVKWLLGLIGRPEYASSAPYLALALLAGPARILYGLVEGVLIAHGQGRFLAISAVLVALAASVAIFATGALGSMAVAFAIFALAGWVLYAWGLKRVASLGLAEPADERDAS